MITLVLGGARSGKSEVAERLAAALPPPITYLATAVVGDDQDFAARVAAHRARRPTSWRTVEAGPRLAEVLTEVRGSALVESLGTWVAALPDFAADTERLNAALRSRTGDTVVVSEEVGLGVHPSSEPGRRFRDALGLVNQAVAAAADRAVLVVAGRVIELGPL